MRCLLIMPCGVFNFTLRSNDVRLDVDVHSSNPPAPMSQATVLGKPKHIARNVMEGGYTEETVKSQTDLTEPQGIIKKRKDTLCLKPT